MKKLKLSTASKQMKNLFLLLLSYLSILDASAQAPDWLWAKGAGGTGGDFASEIALDGSGNSYVTGAFYSSSISFGSTLLPNWDSSTGDIFVVKYDPSGTVLWAKSAGGTGHGGGTGIAVDGSGNSYVTGYFTGGNIHCGSTILVNADTLESYDVFLIKYDPSGNVLWAKSAGGTGYEEGSAIAVDGNGSSYVTGYFSSDSISFGSTILTNADTLGTTDIFVVKYDPSGNVLWAKNAGGNNFEAVADIAVDGSGNSYITGYFSSDSIGFGSTILTNADTLGTTDIFVVKYDPSGNVLWAKSAGGAEEDLGMGIALDGSGNSHVTGTFASSSISFDSALLIHAGGPIQCGIWGMYPCPDLFVVKYDPSGDVLWAKGAGGTGPDVGWDIAVDAGGNIYVTVGSASGSLSFGNFTLMNGGGIVKYDSSANVLWAKSAATGRSISVDGSGFSYITGTFSTDSISFGSTTLTNAGGSIPHDVFVAKLDASPNSIEEVAATGAWKAYPNPVKDILHIRSSNNKLAGLIHIYDYTGRRVLEKTVDGNQAEINLQHLPAGLYWIRVGAEGIKVVKE